MIEDVYKKLNIEETQARVQAVLAALNDYQRAAVIDHSQALLVNAHVGSGKTTVLIRKILYLHFVKGVPLQAMVVLTFTNKAAQEIKERLRLENPGIKEEDMLFFGTFHSVARKLLSTVLPIEKTGYTKAFAVADAEEMLEVYERVINENNLSIKYKSKLKKRIEKQKQGDIHYGNMKFEDDMQDFCLFLKAEKAKCNVMEFDDLIDFAIMLLAEGLFAPEWIIVDEFQDCDDTQLKMIEGMLGSKSHLFAVGDPNQIIYSWRGSKSNIFEVFQERFHVKTLSLPINYRSTSNILHAAKSFLGGSQHIEGVRENGHPIYVKRHYNTFNEALYLCDRIQKINEAGIPYKEIAVFYRKQKQAEVISEVFSKHQIPYTVSVKKSLRDIPVLFWLFRLLKAATNPRDKDSIIYAAANRQYGMNLSSKKIRELLRASEALEKSEHKLFLALYHFQSWCQSNPGISSEKLYQYFSLDDHLHPTSISYTEEKALVMQQLNAMLQYCIDRDYTFDTGFKEYINHTALYGSQVLKAHTHEGSDTVKLMTLHASKGLEFKYVFISGANLGMIPLPGKSAAEEEEEKRLFFVGITRAKDYLEISYHTNPEDFGVYGVPSPFLRMIPGELIESEDFGKRDGQLSILKKEIRSNMEKRAAAIVETVSEENSANEAKAEAVYTPEAAVQVQHEKYGIGSVISEDENNITVLFNAYGEKTFSKLFCPLKYLETTK